MSVFSFLFAICLSTTAYAEDPPGADGAAVETTEAEPVPEQPAAKAGTLEQIDAAFGKYFVGPMAKVLFWDVFFWDNSLPSGEGIGLRATGTADGSDFKLKSVLTAETAESSDVLGWEVIAHVSGDGYDLQQLFSARRSEATPAPADAIKHAMTYVELEIREVDGQLQGTIEPVTELPSI